MEDKKLKHLELIQNIVSRMGGNLFYLRGWVITLIAGVLVLLTQISTSERVPLIFIFLITVLFWAYDAYFLGHERMYRDLYNKVRKMSEEEIDFSMDVSEFKQLKKNSLIYCFISPTLRYFYGPLLLAILYAIFFMK